MQTNFKKPGKEKKRSLEKEKEMKQFTLAIRKSVFKILNNQFYLCEFVSNIVTIIEKKKERIQSITSN